MTRTEAADDVLLDHLSDVFRSVGFDGASLTLLSSASGLQRSSLYHRFPGGKAQMAAEVVRRLGGHVIAAALSPISGDSPTAADVARVGAALAAFYEGGAKSCLLETLSIGSSELRDTATTTALSDAASHLIAAFAHVATSAGAQQDEATQRAEDAVAAIEGALVLARVTGNRAPFARAIDRLPGLLLGSTTN